MTTAGAGKGSASPAGLPCQAGLADLRQLWDGPGLGQDPWISSSMKVYRVNEPPPPAPARAPAGRGAAEAVSRGRAGGGHFSRIAWAFRAGKKNCPFNIALAEALGQGFSRDVEGFMPFWHPEVPQLAGVALEGLKPEPITMTDPIRPPWRRSAGPGPSRSVTNTHEEQGDLWRPQPVPTIVTYIYVCPGRMPVPVPVGVVVCISLTSPGSGADVRGAETRSPR